MPSSRVSSPRRGGQFGVAEPGAGAADEGVVDVAGGVAVEDQGAGLVARCRSPRRRTPGTCTGVAPLQRAVGAGDHPADGGDERGRGRTPARSARRPAASSRSSELGHARRGRPRRRARRRTAARGRRRGSRARPRPEPLASAAKQQPGQGHRPGGPDRATAARRAAVAASAASTMPMSSSPPTALGPPGLSAEQVERGGGAGAVVEPGLLEEARTGWSAATATRGRAPAAGRRATARKRSP